MPTFEIRAQATAEIVEIWHIEADTADDARDRFRNAENGQEAAFICQASVDDERDRFVLSVEPADPEPQRPGADYLDRFPPEHRESADRAYQDGFADGANNAGEDGEDSEPQSASPDPEGQSARLPWFVCVSPDYYDDPCDTGYNWAGEADDREDAVRQALTQCHIDNDRAYQGQPEEDWPEDHDGEPETTDPDDLSVTVHAAEPDFRAIGLAVHKGEPGALAMLARALRAVHQI